MRDHAIRLSRSSHGRSDINEPVAGAVKPENIPGEEAAATSRAIEPAAVVGESAAARALLGSRSPYPGVVDPTLVRPSAIAAPTRRQGSGPVPIVAAVGGSPRGLPISPPPSAVIALTRSILGEAESETGLAPALRRLKTKPREEAATGPDLLLTTGWSAHGMSPDLAPPLPAIGHHPMPVVAVSTAAGARPEASVIARASPSPPAESTAVAPEERLHGMVPAMNTGAAPAPSGPEHDQRTDKAADRDASQRADQAWRSVMDRLRIEQERRGFAAWP
jgi:hypothetical protein